MFWKDATEGWLMVANMFNQVNALWAVAILFFLYVVSVDLRPIMTSKRKVKNVVWAIGKASFTLKEAACFIESIQLTSFDVSSDAQSRLTELKHYAENYQLPLLQNGDSRDVDRPYPRPKVTDDSRVVRSEVESIKDSGINLWWRIGAKSNYEKNST